MKDYAESLKSQEKIEKKDDAPELVPDFEDVSNQ